MELRNTRGCTGFSLKMIAVITMLIDHVAAIILQRALVQGPAAGYIDRFNYGQWELVYELMRAVGRMAFPIYCFLLVEGFVHTRNVRKYLGRMAIFAILSEVPFDLAFKRSVWDMSYNSVFLTLLIGLMVITIIHGIDEKLFVNKNTLLHKYLKCFAIAATILGGMIVAEFLHTDYSAAGIAAIAIMYVLRNNRMISFAAGVVALGVISSPSELYALLMLIPIYQYHGVQGPKLKYFFYAFYPVHLLILAGICYLMGL